jgi:hypothetical protein
MEHRGDKLELLTKNISQTSYRINDYYDLLDAIDGEEEREKVIDCITGEKMALRTLQEILDKCKPEKDKKKDKEDKKDRKEHHKDDDVEVIFIDALEEKKGDK